MASKRTSPLSFWVPTDYNRGVLPSIHFSSLLSCLTRERLVEVGRALSVSQTSKAGKERQGRPLEVLWEGKLSTQIRHRHTQALAGLTALDAARNFGAYLIAAPTCDGANLFIAADVGLGKTIETDLVQQKPGEARPNWFNLDHSAQRRTFHCFGEEIMGFRAAGRIHEECWSCLV